MIGRTKVHFGFWKPTLLGNLLNVEDFQCGTVFSAQRNMLLKPKANRLNTKGFKLVSRQVCTVVESPGGGRVGDPEVIL